MSFAIVIGADSQPDTGFKIVIGTKPPSSSVMNIIIGKAAQPDVGFQIVIDTTPFGSTTSSDMGIVIGADPQPDAGFGIVIGSSPGGAVLLDIRIPVVSPGAMLLAMVVHTEPIYPNTDGWTMQAREFGAGDFKMDVWSRKATGIESGTTLSFFSPTPQEVQGALLAMNAVDDSIFEASASTSTSSSASIITPSASPKHPLDTILCAWWIDGASNLSPPSGFTKLDTYSSSVVSLHTFLVAYKTSGAALPSSFGPAISSGVVDGQAWTFIVKDDVVDNAIPADFSGLDIVGEALDRISFQFDKD